MEKRVQADKPPHHQETEVKLYFANLEAIRERLESIGATVKETRIHERNMRYDKADGSFADDGFVLRLRKSHDIYLTYKEPSITERGIVQREELEVTVSDYDTMEQILKKLGYESYLFYEKYRTTYALDDAEIMLDELPFGNFIEVEGDSETIEAILKKLDLADVERRTHSYTELFDFIKHHRELDFRDITFDNFANVTITERDLIPPGSIVIE